MTQEQLATIVAVGDAIRADPRAWTNLTDYEQAVLMAGLMPAPSFIPLQREYLSRWWLLETPEGIADLNTLCPPHTVIAGRADAEGNLYVCADLLSDALNGGRLAALLPLLQTRVLTYILPEEWPVPPPEEIESSEP